MEQFFDGKGRAAAPGAADYEQLQLSGVSPERSVDRLLLWMILEAARLNVAVGNLTSADIAGLQAEYDHMDAQDYQGDGRKNSIVPWDDPQIPFECACGCIIYSDTEHEC